MTARPSPGSAPRTAIRRQSCASRRGPAFSGPLDVGTGPVQRSPMVANRLKRQLRFLTAIAAATLLGSSLALARAAPSPHDSSAAHAQAAGNSGSAPCFFLREWEGHWKTTPDARVMYISVSRHVYRLELAVAYPLLKSHWAVLLYRDSSSTICSPNDFRLVVSDQIGVKEQVIVRHMTRLTAAQAAALPKTLHPSN